MACGVPIVALRQGGWADMIVHGKNGLLAATGDELAALATELAHDEPRRLQLAAAARHSLENELANPDRIWQHWQQLFTELDR